MNQDDDASYKLIFAAPEVVRDLVLGFIPDAWLHGLDYSTLEKVPASYVADDLRQRSDDVVWRVKAGEDWLYLYILIEFQSTVDPFMAVRLLVYVGLLYQDLIRRQEVKPGHPLPPVLPIVLYNGGKTWTAPTDLAALLPRVPGLVANYLPQLQYLLIDENRYGEEELAAMRNLVAAIIRFEHPANDQALLGLIDLLNDWLAGRPELKRTFALWIRALLLRRSKHTLVLPQVRDLTELKMTLAEKFDQWAEQYKREGRQEGRLEGETLLLQRQLARRFGPLPAGVIARIAAATVEEIETWGDRVLDARTLDEVFRP
ncbi:MAG: DUF4351 domain-containing protein [Gammaproteobacteria bacterium]|nr:DUF4351 domain-containing protein [Gammaproteobacteria bacterium]